MATCLAVSGSRAAFLHVSIVMLAALLLGILTRSASIRIRALAIPLAVLGLGSILHPIVFPEAFHAITDRIQEAYAVESKFSSLGIFWRALYDYLDFFRLLATTPLSGYGLGLGGNGRIFLSSSDAVSLSDIYAESDWSRHIIDLGSVLGIFYILYRITWFLTLLSQCIKAARQTESPLPMMLFGYCGIGLLNGQLTGHGLVGGFLWLFIGLCMVAIKDSSPRL